MPPESPIPFASSPGAWHTGSLISPPIPVDSSGVSPSCPPIRGFPRRRPKRPAAPFLPTPKIKPDPLCFTGFRPPASITAFLVCRTRHNWRQFSSLSIAHSVLYGIADHCPLQSPVQREL